MLFLSFKAIFRFVQHANSAESEGRGTVTFPRPTALPSVHAFPIPLRPLLRLRPFLPFLLGTLSVLFQELTPPSLEKPEDTCVGQVLALPCSYSTLPTSPFQQCHSPCSRTHHHLSLPLPSPSIFPTLHPSRGYAFKGDALNA